MADWSYPVTDWRTGNLVHDDAPILVADFTDGLGLGQGTLNGSVPLSGPVPVDDLLLPWRRVIWPCWRGQPLGCYVVTAKSAYNLGDSSVGFVAQRADAIFARRKIWSTLVFVQQDQLNIARNLLAYGMGLSALGSVEPTYLARMEAKGLEARIPWLSFDPALSGVLRDRLDNQDGYQAARDLSVADAVTSLSQVVDGFEIRLDYRRDPNTRALSAVIRFGYPFLGRQYPVIPLEYPGNVNKAAEAEDTSDTETVSRIFGAGTGVERLMGTPAVDTAAHAEGWPLLEGSESGSASDAATLASNAQARLEAHWRVNVGWTAELPETVTAPNGETRAILGTYELGDVAQQLIRDPRWGTWRGYVRVVGHKLSPSRVGRAGTITPSLVEVRQ